MDHKQWLDNEYSEWVKALQESTVHNFKEHPTVLRMLSKIDTDLFFPLIDAINVNNYNVIGEIELIGVENIGYSPGRMYRMIYYAQQVLKKNPKSICEIGGGVGQFYAILRALGYEGKYYITDLPQVMDFQRKYLDEVQRQTWLNLPTEFSDFDFCCSFYAIGEFNQSIKNHMFGMTINPCPHGYIAWNPHSGASDDLSLFKHKIKVTPGIEDGVKIIQW